MACYSMQWLSRPKIENADDLDDLNHHQGDGDDMSVSTGGTIDDNENSENDESLSPAGWRASRMRMNKDVENVGSRLEDFLF
jgi:hypothetical protein